VAESSWCGIVAAFAAAYPTASPLAPLQYSGSFDNSGGTVVLYSPNGTEIFRFTYTDSVAGTDGDGRTLVRVLSSTNPDPLSYVWRASTGPGGNPGGSDSVAFSGAPSADLDGDGIQRSSNTPLEAATSSSRTRRPGRLATIRWGTNSSSCTVQ
jgi:hypothetical protein